MSSNSSIRRVPIGAVVILAVLTGTIIAQQIVPASATPEQPVPRRAIDAIVAPITPPAEVTSAKRLDDHGDEMAALISQALDQKTDLNIKDKPIGAAFEALASQTGIPISIEPGTFCLLPNDTRTLVSATIKNRPLRESLTALLRPIALRFEVQDQRLLILPTPPLRRSPERASWKELDLLAKLETTPWSEDLAKSLKFQFHRTPLTLADVNRETLMALAEKAGEGTASEILELATNHYGWTWHVHDDLIVILPKTRQIELQLERRITADYTRASVQDTLMDLAQKAGVPLRFDPGALASLSPFVAERFNLKVVNTSIKDALQITAGQTGLPYYIEPEGVRITASVLDSSGTPAPRSPDSTGIAQDTAALLRENSVVAQIEMPSGRDGRKFVIVVRRRDLPEDVRDLISAVIADSVEPIRLTLQASRAAIKPATRPHD